MNKECWKSNVGVNSNIRSHILPKEQMYNIGFTHYLEDGWYFYRMIDDGISFNVVIADDNSFLGIQVLLEEYFKPLDRIDAEKLLGEERADELNKRVVWWMRRLADVGILEGDIE